MRERVVTAAAVTRGRWLLLAVALLALAGYVAYDWSRPCTGGPVKQGVMAVVQGGSYTVRCAG